MFEYICLTIAGIWALSVNYQLFLIGQALKSKPTPAIEGKVLISEKRKKVLDFNELSR